MIVATTCLLHVVAATNWSSCCCGIVAYVFLVSIVHLGLLGLVLFRSQPTQRFDDYLHATDMSDEKATVSSIRSGSEETHPHPRCWSPTYSGSEGIDPFRGVGSRGVLTFWVESNPGALKIPNSEDKTARPRHSIKKTFHSSLQPPKKAKPRLHQMLKERDYPTPVHSVLSLFPKDVFLCVCQRVTNAAVFGHFFAVF